ncbi:MAG TPA: hypothetical protein VMW54_13710 [Terriglobia bacterium]|nr:hypothetical protein [Terriglobia bacterium]
MKMVDFPQWQNEQKYALGHLRANPKTSELSVEPGKTPLQKPTSSCTVCTSHPNKRNNLLHQWPLARMLQLIGPFWISSLPVINQQIERVLKTAANGDIFSLFHFKTKSQTLIGDHNTTVYPLAQKSAPE